MALLAMSESLRSAVLSLENRRREREYGSSIASTSPRRSVRSIRTRSNASPARLPLRYDGGSSTPRDLNTKPWVAVYQDLVESGKGVPLSGLLMSLAKHDVHLEASVVEDVFAKADRDKDGYLSQEEFRVLSRDYATLVGCLLTRSRRRLREQEMAEGLDAAKARLTALLEEDERDAQEVEAGRQDLMSKYETLKGKQASAADCDARLRSAKSSLEATNEELQSATNEAHAATSMMKKCQQYSKQATEELREADETKDHAIKQLKAQEAKEAVASERLRELQEQVKQQQQEVERQHQRTQRLYQEAKKATKSCSAVRQAVDKWKSDLTECDKSMQASNEKLRAATEKARETEAKHERLEQHLQELTVEHSAADRQVQALEKRVEDTESQRLAGQRPTQLRVREKEKTVERLQAEVEAERAKRKSVEEEELPVLQMEVKLRRQRETLEAAERELQQSRTQLDKKTAEVSHAAAPAHATELPSESPDRFEDDPLGDALSSPREFSGTSNTFAPTLTTASPRRLYSHSQYTR